MPREHIKRPVNGAICSECESDLHARKDGRVYCTNTRCKHYREPHVTGQHINAPSDAR